MAGNNKSLFGNISKCDLAAYAIIAVFILFWGIVLTAKYFSFGYYDWDLAICANTMWNLSQGSPHVSLLDLNNFLGNHVTPIAFLLVPLYKIIPHPLVLVYLQALSVLLSAFVIYSIAKREIDIILSFAVLVSYLVYPALWSGILYEFHFVSLSVIFLSLMFLYFYKRDFTKFVVFTILSLLCREDISLIIFGFGLYTLFTKYPLRWKVFPLVAGVSWAYISIRIIGPHFSNRHEYAYSFLFGNLGANWWDVAKNIALHPVVIFKKIFLSKLNIQYFRNLFVPVGFFPCAKFVMLIPILPLMFLHLLSGEWHLHSILFHYTLPMIPFIFLATIFGIKSLSRFNFTKLILVVLIFGLIASYCIISFGKISATLRLIKEDNRPFNNLTGKKRELVSEIPKNASVIASFKFLPFLSDRKKIYSAHYLFVSRFSPLADYALIDFNEPFFVGSYYYKGSDALLYTYIKHNKFCLLKSINDVVLLKRNCDSGLNLYEIEQKPNTVTTPFVEINNEINLLKFSLSPYEIKPGRIIEFNFHWQSEKITDKEYTMRLFLTDNKNKIAYRLNHSIGYHMYPTQEWKEGKCIKETYKFLVPNLKAGRYTLRILFFDFFSGQTAMVKSQNNNVVEDNRLVNLGELHIIGQEK